MPSFLAALALLILAAGCSFFGLNDLASDAQGGELVQQTDSTEIVRLEAGQSIQLTVAEARLRFAGKLEDSRCPIGVTCVWEGEIVARLELTPAGGETTSLELKGYVGPDGDGTLSAATDGLHLTLLGLDPYPVEGQPQGDAPDVATIRVARR